MEVYRSNQKHTTIDLLTRLPSAYFFQASYIFRYFEQISYTLRENPHMFYTPSFTLSYSRKGEMRGTQNEGLFSGLD